MWIKIRVSVFEPLPNILKVYARRSSPSAQCFILQSFFSLAAAVGGEFVAERVNLDLLLSAVAQSMGKLVQSPIKSILTADPKRAAHLQQDAAVSLGQGQLMKK